MKRGCRYTRYLLMICCFLTFLLSGTGRTGKSKMAAPMKIYPSEIKNYQLRERIYILQFQGSYAIFRIILNNSDTSVSLSILSFYLRTCNKIHRFCTVKCLILLVILCLNNLLVPHNMWHRTLN